MKKINEKWGLFLIATFTIFFGITNDLLKGTEAKKEDNLTDIVMLNFDEMGLKDIILGDIDVNFKTDVYIYNVKVNKLDNLFIVPALTNDNIVYTVDVVGNPNVDKNIEIIVSVNIGLKNEKKYTLFIEEI